MSVVDVKILSGSLLTPLCVSGRMMGMRVDVVSAYGSWADGLSVSHIHDRTGGTEEIHRRCGFHF